MGNAHFTRVVGRLTGGLEAVLALGFCEKEATEEAAVALAQSRRERRAAARGAVLEREQRAVAAAVGAAALHGAQAVGEGDDDVAAPRRVGRCVQQRFHTFDAVDARRGAPPSSAPRRSRGRHA